MNGENKFNPKRKAKEKKEESPDKKNIKKGIFDVLF